MDGPKRRTLCILFVLCNLVCLFCLMQYPLQATASDTFVFSGTIKEENNPTKAITDAYLVVEGNSVSPDYDDVIIDENGSFEIVMPVNAEGVFLVVTSAPGYADNCRVIMAVPGGSEQVNIELRPVSERTYIAADEGIISGLLAGAKDAKREEVRITENSTDDEIQASLAIVNGSGALNEETADGTLGLSFGYSMEDDLAMLSWNILTLDEVLYDPLAYESDTAFVELTGKVLDYVTNEVIPGALLEFEGKEVVAYSDSQDMDKGRWQ